MMVQDGSDESVQGRRGECRKGQPEKTKVAIVNASRPRSAAILIKAVHGNRYWTAPIPDRKPN